MFWMQILLQVTSYEEYDAHLSFCKRFRMSTIRNERKCIEKLVGMFCNVDVFGHEGRVMDIRVSSGLTMGTCLFLIIIESCYDWLYR